MRIPALAILTIATASAAPSARAQTYDPAYYGAARQRRRHDETGGIAASIEFQSP